MSAPFVTAVMVHVSSIDEALAWYERVFPNALRSSTAEEEFDFLQVGEVRLEFVLADQKVASGPSGSVVYWQFPHFEEAFHRFQAAGAKLYRGPMSMAGGQLMCQVQDPWSNCIGLRGPSSLGKTKSATRPPPSTAIERARPGKPGRSR